MSIDSRCKHLELIQSVVSRMAANSFHVKGWSTAILSGLLALGLTKSDVSFARLALFPLFVLWALDGYYLGLEKGFRHVYDRVRSSTESEVDFSLTLLPSERGLGKWVAGCFAVPNLLFHGSALIVVTVVLISISRN